MVCELYFYITDLLSERKIIFAIGYFWDKTDK